MRSNVVILIDLVQRVERRFIDLGYLPADFGDNMRMHKFVRQKTRLTENSKSSSCFHFSSYGCVVWQRILAFFGPQIAEKKEIRLQHAVDQPLDAM